MYRTELGPAGSPVGQAARLSAHELASSLAFLFLNSIPDEELWAKAADGTLAEPAVMQAQVERLLALPRVQDNLTDIVAGWTGLPELFAIEKTEADRDGIEFNQAMRQSMYDETWSFIDSVLWNGGTVPELLTSRRAFVDETMADFYEVEFPGGNEAALVDLPQERSGILTRAGLITSMRYGLNPEVFRGLLLRETILCGEIPDPPADLDIDGFNAQYGGLSTRERIQVRQNEVSCAGCHAFMDELGIAYDTFGAMGQPITLVNDVAANPAGALTGTDVDGPYTDLVDLSSRLATSAAVRQ
jgi:hypothetical protein